MTTDKAAAPAGATTPLIDLLRDVPADARVIYALTPIQSMSIPVGRLCAEAVKEIERLSAPVGAVPQDAAKVIDFLYGVGPLDGGWIGEHHPAHTGLYWWRQFLPVLTRALASQAARMGERDAALVELAETWRAGAQSNDHSLDAPGIQPTTHAALKHGALTLRRCAAAIDNLRGEAG